MADGTIELDLRATLETDDGALIHMTFTGVRDDANSYFRTVPRFETAVPKYAFLNRLPCGRHRGDSPGRTGPFHRGDLVKEDKNERSSVFGRRRPPKPHIS